MARESPRSLLRPSLWGAIAGLAFLTKLSGVLAIVAAAGAYWLDGWRRGEGGLGLRRAFVVAVVGGAVGGWFYARNLLVYGYLYPHGLDVHAH